MNKLMMIFTLLLLAACGAGDEHGDHDTHEHDTAAEIAKGPHGGRLLEDGDISVELAIFETSTPPEYRAWVSRAGKPVPPSEVKLTVELTRLGGKRDRFEFTPQDAYLQGDGVIAEPHSFDVKVIAIVAGKSHVWTYPSYEGRVTITASMAVKAGIETAAAGPGTLREVATLRGSVVPNPERVRHVVARFAGPIRTVHKQIGDSVRAGDTLATVESNESLKTYAVTTPIGGVITQRRANIGEVAGSEPLFVIADYSTLWAELNFFAKDRARIRVGQPVNLRATEGEPVARGVVAHIAPTANQTFIARVEIDNTDGRWIPGLFVDADVSISEIAAPLVVANSALQTFRDFTVVFAQVGDDAQSTHTYEVRMLDIGRSDGEFTEVLGGLESGTTYVTTNSYLIKADIEKSGASHDH